MEKALKQKFQRKRKYFWNHLAAKIYVLATAPKPLLKQLDENEQTHLYWEMELPLSDILARMEIERNSSGSESSNRNGPTVRRASQRNRTNDL